MKAGENFRAKTGADRTFRPRFSSALTPILGFSRGLAQRIAPARAEPA